MRLSTTFWIQLLGMIFGAGMMYFTYVRYKRKELSNFELLLWFSGWVALILVAIIPSILDFVIEPLNFYRRLDFFVVLGFFVLLLLGFYNYGLVKGMEKKLEKFVRREAMRRHREEVEKEHEIR